MAGTFFGTTPRIVKINGRHVEAKPEGVLFLLENRDRPGIVGHVGTLMGKHDVNIASMSLSRNEAGGSALTVLNLDSVPRPELVTGTARRGRHRTPRRSCNCENRRRRIRRGAKGAVRVRFVRAGSGLKLAARRARGGVFRQAERAALPPPREHPLRRRSASGRSSTPAACARIAGTAAMSLKKIGRTALALALEDWPQFAGPAVEGVLLADYRFDALQGAESRAAGMACA